ncbi:hypothetical protein [Nocardia inohanensis]|uniref:hypothetical protein n=1 Tax=Nocardia inohanensis TaxID=209246 RepID=UPI000AE8E8CF|nr:hypothetical protein [Nocardia inohanensis]
MTRYQRFRTAQISGHVSWWVFIVAAMLDRGITWFDSSEADFFPWDPYAPLTDMPRRYADYLPSDGFEHLGVTSLIGFCLLVLSALAEAVVVRRFIAGIVTVTVPFVAALLIWSALPGGHRNFVLMPFTALLVILIAVAIREAWERKFAPTIAPA